MRGLHAGVPRRRHRADLEIYPNLWAGVGLVRGGAGTALVGSHEEVADLIEEYAALGIDEFIMSGYPHLEEAYWFGEGVLPELRRRGTAAAPAISPGCSLPPDRRQRAEPPAASARAATRPGVHLPAGAASGPTTGGTDEFRRPGRQPQAGIQDAAVAAAAAGAVSRATGLTAELPAH